jgi:hypothetical protein
LHINDSSSPKLTFRRYIAPPNTNQLSLLQRGS